MPLVMAKQGDSAEARRLQRMAEQGQLRRLYPGIYTNDSAQPIEAIVRRELFSLCARIARGCIISHRSALESHHYTGGGNVYLTGPNRRDYALPGLQLRVARGEGPLDSDIRIPTFSGDAFVSSQARALLENLTQSRGAHAERRTLGAEGVEAWLDRFISRDVNGAINQLRDAAREVAKPLGLQKQFILLDGKISALLGTREAPLRAKAAIARAAGRPYDDARVTLFASLASALQRDALQIPLADARADNTLQAFIETYFSNYIEGTEFEIEEAHHIVVRGRPMQYREDDSHDILGTYQAILESKAKPRLAADFGEFVAQLQAWNRQVIRSRQEKGPGEFKTRINRAGNTVFVAPDLVVGTLEKGFEIIMSATTPANRAAVAMFVIAEVHPFTDGNGRTARIAMNHFLTQAGLTRVVIAAVNRDDYISALKAMSSNDHSLPLLRMLTRAGRFSRWLDMSSKDRAFAAIKGSNALEKSDVSRLAFDDGRPAD